MRSQPQHTHSSNTNPSIRQLLKRMPTRVQHSFTEEQLAYLTTALSARQWGTHQVDIRGTVKFFHRRYYYVLLAGKNYREPGRREKQLSRIVQAAIMSMLLCFSLLLGVTVLYLIKSAMGIDIFPHLSLGLWSWVKALIA